MKDMNGKVNLKILFRNLVEKAYNLNLTPTLSEFEILDHATLIIKNDDFLLKHK